MIDGNKEEISCDLLSKLPTVLLRGVFLHYRSQQLLTFRELAEKAQNLSPVRGLFLLVLVGRVFRFPLGGKVAYNLY